MYTHNKTKSTLNLLRRDFTPVLKSSTSSGIVSISGVSNTCSLSSLASNIFSGSSLFKECPSKVLEAGLLGREGSSTTPLRFKRGNRIPVKVRLMRASRQMALSGMPSESKRALSRSSLTSVDRLCLKNSSEPSTTTGKEPIINSRAFPSSLRCLSRSNWGC